QEIIIAVSRITREQPRGETRGWLEILQELLRRGVRVSLVVAELPPPDRNDLEGMGLRNHLYLLVEQYSLNLSVVRDDQLPLWHVVIDPAGSRSRAIRIEQAEPRLDQRTGDIGMVTTFNPEGVIAIADAIKAAFGRTVSGSELEPPVGIRIHHIKDG